MSPAWKTALKAAEYFQGVIQVPLHNGTLNATGKLSVDSGLNAGFDICSDEAGHSRTIYVRR